MDRVKNLLSPLASGTINDTLVSLSETQGPSRVTEKCQRTHVLSSQKLVVIGGTMETARRASVSAWNGFVDCNTISLLAFSHETRSAVKSQNSVLPDRALLSGGLSGKCGSPADVRAGHPKLNWCWLISLPTV